MDYRAPMENSCAGLHLPLAFAKRMIEQQRGKRDAADDDALKRAEYAAERDGRRDQPADQRAAQDIEDSAAPAPPR